MSDGIWLGSGTGTQPVDQTTAHGQIYSLIPKVMSDIGAVAKTQRNEQQKWNFRGIEDMYLAANPAMVKHGIFCAPRVLKREVYRFEKTNDMGRVSTWTHVALEVEHRFYAGDGSYVQVITWGEGLDFSDKATYKAMSGAMKYALIETFCVPTKDVEDSDRDSHEMGMRRATEVERITEDIPIVKPDASAKKKKEPATIPENTRAISDNDSLITVDQAQKLHRRFRESLPESMQAQADSILYDWLGSKMYVDAAGNPSSKVIRKDEYAAVGKSAVEFAKELA